tara:strand:+ start:20 stop:805 length:786 start_codon:yes stop_codon:yes gene_type:complete
MITKRIIKTVKPNVGIRGNVAFQDDDLLFDWTAFQIPKGVVDLKSIAYMIRGTEAAGGNGALDFEIYFATSHPTTGVAPPSLGTVNAAPTAINTALCRPHIIGKYLFDGSSMEDASDGLITYNIGSGNRNYEGQMIEGSTTFAGDSTYSATVQGFQTIWIAGISKGAFDFGTGVLLDDADDQAAATVATGLVTDGVDADDIFVVGDEIIAYASNGSSEQVVGTVTAVAANLLTVDAVAGTVTDDDELCFHQPIHLHLGFEY